MPNKVYDVLKWVVIVVMPAFITFYGVLGNTLGIPYTDVVLTIMAAFNTFLGTCTGISNVQYNKKRCDSE